MDGTAREPEYREATDDEARTIREQIMAAEESLEAPAQDPNGSLAASVATLVKAGLFGEGVPVPANRAQARALVGGSRRKKGARGRAFKAFAKAQA